MTRDEIIAQALGFNTELYEIETGTDCEDVEKIEAHAEKIARFADALPPSERALFQDWCVMPE